MDMGEKIYYSRIENHLTLEQLGDMVGVGKSTVRKWENGMIANMKRDKIYKLAKALKVSPAYLMGWEDKDFSNSITPVKIPVLGRVAAGIPFSATEYIIDTEEISQAMASDGEYFGLQIKGDSMEPKISNGDVVIVRKQSDADEDDLVIALINGNDATCKRLKKYKEGIALISNNPAYQPMYFSNQDIAEKPVEIIGKVKELRAKF